MELWKEPTPNRQTQEWWLFLDVDHNSKCEMEGEERNIESEENNREGRGR